MEISNQSWPRKIIGMMINPASVLKSVLEEKKWYLSLIISSLAFALLFFQTGFDLYRTGQEGISSVLYFTIIGIGYGAIVIPIIGVLVWLILKIVKSDLTMTQGISVICLSYSGAIVYGISGLFFSFVLGWSTSIAFGVTGVLWAIGPMMYTIRRISGGKRALSISLSTIVGILVLMSWYMLGKGW